MAYRLLMIDHFWLKLLMIRFVASIGDAVTVVHAAPVVFECGPHRDIPTCPSIGNKRIVSNTRDS